MEYFAINNNSYFEHHGILGQKWGKKNGPPYPLDYDKLSPEERSKDKERAVSEGDVSSATYKNNMRYFSNQELRDIETRYKINQSIKALNAQQINAGKKNLDDTIAKLGKVGEAGRKLSDGIKAGTDVYNGVAKVMNAFGDKNLPIIGDKKKDSIRDLAGKMAEDVFKDAAKYTKEELKTYNDWRSEVNKIENYVNKDKKKG